MTTCRLNVVSVDALHLDTLHHFAVRRRNRDLGICEPAATGCIDGILTRIVIVGGPLSRSSWRRAGRHTILPCRTAGQSQGTAGAATAAIRCPPASWFLRVEASLQPDAPQSTLPRSGRQAPYLQARKAMSDAAPIYEDASQSAILNCPTGSTPCLTLQEAVIAWRAMPEEDKGRASIRVRGGRLYSAEEIDRLHHA